jgi:hypothetical protein
MILDSEFHASRLVGDHHSAQQLCMKPNLPTLPDHHSFGIGPGKVRFKCLDDVYLFLVKYQLVLALVCDSYGGTDFISDRGEA